MSAAKAAAVADDRAALDREVAADAGLAVAGAAATARSPALRVARRARPAPARCAVAACQRASRQVSAAPSTRGGAGLRLRFGDAALRIEGQSQFGIARGEPRLRCAAAAGVEFSELGAPLATVAFGVGLPASFAAQL